ncbi:unnamed protein product [Moneuplotes crassus]|uniref:Uncharacterized protein n=1 Tax=Euplotes crassus TaxID=5936 RepID=A0AAD1Y9J6_EUPCR|nr:unnamed protein product [Moneuplotes crassus]
MRRQRNRAKVWYPYDFQKGGLQDSQKQIGECEEEKNGKGEQFHCEKTNDMEKLPLLAPSSYGMSRTDCQTAESQERISVSGIPVVIEKY